MSPSPSPIQSTESHSPGDTPEESPGASEEPSPPGSATPIESSPTVSPTPEDDGDLDGDGLPDLAVGAPDSVDGTQPGAGLVHIFYGGGIPESADFKLAGITVEEKVGNFIARAGDVNDDGRSDILVGTNRHFVPGAPDAGIVSLWLGSERLTGTWNLSEGPLHIEGNERESQLGGPFSFVGAGDVNGNGLGDWLAGSPAYNDVPGLSVVHVILGQETP